MTIEDCISKLTEILEEATEDENSVCYVTDVDEPTLKTAIETMRKYQKIEQIYNKYYCTMTAMARITQVIKGDEKDGNDD